MIVVKYVPVDEGNEPQWPNAGGMPTEMWLAFDQQSNAYAAAFDDTGVDTTGMADVTDAKLTDKLKAFGAPLRP